MNTMKRVLITGMSGAGKSSVIQELVERGYRSFDLDTPEWSEWVDANPGDDLTPADGKDWVWREDHVRTLLSQPDADLLFVGGCATNMDRLRPFIDLTILLSAPLATVMTRLEARSSNGYGRTLDGRNKVVELISTVEPLLRNNADHEIVTDRPVRATVDEILRLSSS